MQMASTEELRARLERDRTQVLERLELLRADTASADETREGSPFGKREEEATEAFELEKRIALEHNLRETLNEITRALERMDSGTYGRCEVCGNDIEPDRLEARPQASRCIRCKGQQSKSAPGVQA